MGLTTSLISGIKNCRKAGAGHRFEVDGPDGDIQYYITITSMMIYEWIASDNNEQGGNWVNTESHQVVVSAILNACSSTSGEVEPVVEHPEEPEMDSAERTLGLVTGSAVQAGGLGRVDKVLMVTRS